MNITGPHKIAALLKRALKFQWAVFGEDHYILIRKKKCFQIGQREEKYTTNKVCFVLDLRLSPLATGTLWVK